MFLTITIDTNNKKKQLIKFRKQRLNALRGWKRPLNAKAINFFQKIYSGMRGLKRSLKGSCYKLGRQIAML